MGSFHVGKGRDQGGLVLLLGEASYMQQLRMIGSDAEQMPLAGAGQSRAWRVNTVCNSPQRCRVWHMGHCLMPPTRRPRRDSNQLCHIAQHRAVILPLQRIVDLPRQVLGPHNRHPGAAPCTNQGLPLSTDARVDVQKRDTSARQPSGPGAGIHYIGGQAHAAGDQHKALALTAALKRPVRGEVRPKVAGKRDHVMPDA